MQIATPVLMLVIVLVPVVAIAATSSQPFVLSLPSSDSWFGSGSLFSSFSIWQEKINMWLTFDPTKQAQGYLNLSQMRFNDFKNQVKNGDTTGAINTLNLYASDLKTAADKMQQIKGQPEKLQQLTNTFKTTVNGNINYVNHYADGAPGAAKSAIASFLSGFSQSLGDLNAKLGR